MKKGIEFILLVVGQEGTGKNCFINTLCDREVIKNEFDEIIKPKNSHLNPGINIIKTHVNITEQNSTPISLDLILAPGFGSNINNEDCIPKLVEYLERQFDDVLKYEYKIKRDLKFKDGRPHACLYFIRPTSKGLTELDIETMKLLSTRVNIIPIISKADTLNEDEVALNKALISQDIKANNIPIYDFAVDNEDDDNEAEVELPFIVSGSLTKKVIDNETFHVREYPWGDFKIEDVDHCDFTLLKNVLFGSHLEDLKDTTHSVLYEHFRSRKLYENLEKRGALNRGDATIADASNSGIFEFPIEL